MNSLDPNEEMKKTIKPVFLAPTPQPPEDLRRTVLNVVARIIDKDMIDYLGENSIDKVTDQILRLCEAAALAVLPEKKNPSRYSANDDPYEYNRDLGYDQAITTAQANIHSVFGGDGK